MADGSAAGLQSGTAIKADIEKRKAQERAAMAKLDPSLLGRNAATVHRDSMGRKVNVAEEERLAAEAAAAAAAKLARELQLSTGLAQRQATKLYQDRLELEKSTPLAISVNDVSLNAEQAAQVRWDDPMRAAVRTGKAAGTRPRYTGPRPPPNRFNIAPGYRWDGVDRSNGFEARFFMAKNERAARSEAGYKWSTEDM